LEVVAPKSIFDVSALFFSLILRFVADVIEILEGFL